MKAKNIFASVLTLFLIAFSCINTHAIIFNRGPNGKLEAMIDCEEKTIILIAGPKMYICDLNDNIYECDDGTNGKFRNFIPFSSEGTVPPNYMDRIRVAMIFYNNDLKITYLTDGTLIQETYIDRSIDRKTKQIKKGTFSLSSSVDSTIETVEGTTCITGTCYYCRNGFDEQHSIEQYQPGYNPFFANAATEYQVDPKNPGTGLYLFQIFLSNGGICLRGGDALSKSHDVEKKLRNQQENQIFKLSRINRETEISEEDSEKTQDIPFEKLENSLETQDLGTVSAVPKSLLFKRHTEIYEPLLKKEEQIKTIEPKSCLESIYEIIIKFFRQ